MSGSGSQQTSSTDDVRTSVSDGGCNNCESPASSEQPDIVLRYADAVLVHSWWVSGTPVNFNRRLSRPCNRRLAKNAFLEAQLTLTAVNSAVKLNRRKSPVKLHLSGNFLQTWRPIMMIYYFC